MKTSLAGFMSLFRSSSKILEMETGFTGFYSDWQSTSKMAKDTHRTELSTSCCHFRDDFILLFFLFVGELYTTHTHTHTPLELKVKNLLSDGSNANLYECHSQRACTFTKSCLASCLVR